MIIKRKCDNCGKEYLVDTRNLNRGWGLCCNKSCAAQKREKGKDGYDPKRVARNNCKRALWNYRVQHQHIDSDEPNNYDPGDSEYWNEKDF